MSKEAEFSQVMTRVAELAQQENYKEAINTLQQSATYDANYFYNLGILHGKLGNPGLATAYLEKANRLNPHDPEFIQSLLHARADLKASFSKKGLNGQVDAASNQVEKFSDKIHHDEILGVLGLLTLAASLFWIRSYWKTRNIKKALLRPAGWFGTFALVLTYALYGVYRVGSANPPSVSINLQSVRSGPGVGYPEIDSLEIGVKVRIIGSPVNVNEEEIWQKVRYKGEQTGWVPLSGLLPL